jgi:anti-sigma regulatory factor (Ser/Thr protein kinase)
MTLGPHVSLRLPRGPQAPGQARAVVMERFRERLGAKKAVDAALAVTELVAASVQQPGSEHEVGLEVAVEGDHLLIEVRGRGGRFVPRGVAGTKRLGLLIVDRLAGSWGVTRDGAGRARVWAELPLRDD